MTREEAIVYFEKILAGAKQGLEKHPEVGKRVYGMRKELAEIALSALRPVSREQVIFCRDCRFWQGNNGGYPHPECRWGNNETPDEDDYCSFAERLEVSKNG